MTTEALVDALPYIDQGYDEPGVREAAISMVEDECRRYRPTKNYLEALPPLNLSAFETAALRTELERLQNRAPMDTLSMKRYELPPPPAGRLGEPQAWAECVDNSCAQLEHQRVRLLNLRLALTHGPAAWRRYLETLKNVDDKAQARLKELRSALHDVNWQRKSLQTRGGDQLRGLEARWVALVSHNYELEQACSQLEDELALLAKETPTNENTPE
ncbi:pre-mRNA-splicing factor SPF27 [Chrysoperla carnea]|uniref:pre-mRNA-splicing factor SPF27 n=1 Tax=Chrysoperla carnea TaxID=189513 RepID=UPI001D08C07A|nr:pre-mRNA-splicing factor SPF27 [Chrysoperla carnea]